MLPTYMDMKRCMLMCFFMSMLCSKIKFEIDINNDELLRTILEHTREIERGERRGVLLNFNNK